MFPPTEDRSNETKSRLLEQIATALGGRVAEEMEFNDISTGAASDLDVASSIARAMVTEYGMSSLGPINMKSQSSFSMWQRSSEESNQVSENMQSKIDAEVKKIIDESYTQAKAMLRANKSKLDKVAQALLEKETLESEEFEKIVGPKKTSLPKSARTPVVI